MTTLLVTIAFLTISLPLLLGYLVVVGIPFIGLFTGVAYTAGRLTSDARDKRAAKRAAHRRPADVYVVHRPLHKMLQHKAGIILRPNIRHWSYA